MSVAVEINGAFFRYEVPGAGDSLEATAMNDGLSITIENPWAGDSEIGFGAHCAVRMEPDDARALANWILAQFPGEGQ